MADKLKIYEDVLSMTHDEIDNIAKKDELDDKSLEYLYKLVDIAKDIETIMAMHDYSDDDGYSNRMYPYYMYDGDMDMRGNSYRKRDSMGRYSRTGGYSRGSEMRMRLEQMMNDATTDHEREAIRSALERM